MLRDGLTSYMSIPRALNRWQTGKAAFRPAKPQFVLPRIPLLDLNDVGERRAPAARLSHRGDGLRRTGDHYFDLPAAPVAHPALDAKLVRGVLGPGPETDPLHPAMNEKMPDRPRHP